jgi:hypothetical protein
MPPFTKTTAPKKSPAFATKPAPVPSDMADQFYASGKAAGKAPGAKLPQPKASAPKTSSVPLFGGKK